MEQIKDPFAQSFEGGANEQFAMEELTLPLEDERHSTTSHSHSMGGGSEHGMEGGEVGGGGGGRGSKKKGSASLCGSRPPGSNDRERQRRSDLNTNFKTLENLLELSSRTRIEKVTVLAGAIERIKQLRHENIALKQEKCIIRTELTKLTRCLQHAFRGAPPMSEAQLAMAFSTSSVHPGMTAGNSATGPPQLSPPQPPQFVHHHPGVVHHGVDPAHLGVLQQQHGHTNTTTPGGGGGGGGGTGGHLPQPPNNGHFAQTQFPGGGGGGLAMPPPPNGGTSGALDGAAAMAQMSQAFLMDQANFLRGNGGFSLTDPHQQTHQPPPMHTDSAKHE